MELREGSRGAPKTDLLRGRIGQFFQEIFMEFPKKYI